MVARKNWRESLARMTMLKKQQTDMTLDLKSMVHKMVRFRISVSSESNKNSRDVRFLSNCWIVYGNSAEKIHNHSNNKKLIYQQYLRNTQ